MMCTIVIRDVVAVLIFDIMALLIRGAVTFKCEGSAWKIEHLKMKKQKIYTISNFNVEYLLLTELLCMC